MPILREALHGFGFMSVDEALPLHSVAGIVARYTWDDHSWQVLSERHVQLARSVGALSELPVALNARAFMLLFAGELAAAGSLIQQRQADWKIRPDQKVVVKGDWPTPEHRLEAAERIVGQLAKVAKAA